MFRGKKYVESAKLIDRSVQYDPNEALDLVVKGASAKFDETVELHIKLGVDSRHADQQVRGAVVLPNGTGKTRRVLVFTKDAKVEDAKAAGADYVGGMELVEKITKENWFEFDVVVASPDMMGLVGWRGLPILQIRCWVPVPTTCLWQSRRTLPRCWIFCLPTFCCGLPLWQR